MNTAKKFLFDIDFGLKEANNKLEDETLAADPLTIPKYSENDLQKEIKTAMQKGFDDGKKIGLSDALNQIEMQTSSSLDKINIKLNEIDNFYKNVSNQNIKDSTLLALLISKKISNSFIEKYSEDEVTKFVKSLFESFKSSIINEKVIIKLNESILDKVKEKLINLETDAELIFEADNQIKNGDCIIELPSGGFEKKVSDIEAQIQSAIERFLSNIDNKKNDSNDDKDNKSENTDINIKEKEEKTESKVEQKEEIINQVSSTKSKRYQD
ncbi:FliH/SctL family protein [Alphaproteobacteria bacterium]|nr:FliH/SctL family protein [Alphaproteobacteria bacterium]